jgi:hypothetical protein
MATFSAIRSVPRQFVAATDTRRPEVTASAAGDGHDHNDLTLRI